MAQIINTNIASLNAQRNLNNSQSANATALERLSSGLRINSAKDDAAGLAISTRFESQTRGLNQAIRNAGDGISLAQTAEGALGTMTDNLQRIRELAVQSANATNSDDDRVALQQEVSALVAEITRTGEETNFNGRALFDGQFQGTFQIGANAGQTVDVQIAELTAAKLGSSAQAGVSAIGTDSGLQNNDLIINGVSIGSSNAQDDTASIANIEASAIAKVAVINKVSDQTGVTAFANTNVAAGTTMDAQATSGTLVLNGVEIDLQTSSDAGTSRASVTQAINAASDQTGIVAVNTDSDSLGVTLQAADGRNISIGIDNTNGFTGLSLDDVAAATGLAVGSSYNTATNTGDYSTYEGGYTLVANSGTQSITIEGGAGTGNGDLANSGLAAGTYDRATAQVVSTRVTETNSDTINDASVSFGLEGQALAFTNDFTSGSVSAFTTTGGEILTITDGQGNSVVLGSGGDIGLETTSGGFGADKIRDALNTFSGVNAIAETKVTFDGANLNAQTTGTVLNIYDTGTTGAVLGTITFAGSSSDTSQSFAEAINALTTGTLVATVLGTASNADVQVTDINGNTLAFTMLEVSTGGVDINIDVAGRTGGTTSAAIVASTTAANSLGAQAVAVGYIKDVEVADSNVGEFSISTNRAISGTRGTTSAAVNAITTYLATAGAIEATTTTGEVVDTANGNIAITQPLTGLGDGDLVINGVNIGAADPVSDRASATKASDGGTIVSSLKTASGIAVADAINRVSDETGVTASVTATTVVGGDGSGFETAVSPTGGNYAVGDTGELFINGVSIGGVTLLDDGTGSVDEGRTRQQTIDLINAKADQTGVSAVDNGESITLTAEDGRNISVAIDNDEANNQGVGVGFGAAIGLDAAQDGIGEADIGTSTTSDVAGERGVATEGDTYETTYSTVVLSSAREIEIGGGTNGNDEVNALGFKVGTYGGGQDGQFLKDIDVSTFEGAQAAITAIDNALDTVSSQRSELGALQNRFESTVSNLAVTAENLTAANSRIRDADFAAETAELSRTQVLQQAGISILAQANQRPQQVLSLLG
ncbi:MAG: flagellin N-terminal helical domain-containing protein [Saccharospirillum sp.]